MIGWDSASSGFGKATDVEGRVSNSRGMHDQWGGLVAQRVFYCPAGGVRGGMGRGGGG